MQNKTQIKTKLIPKLRFKEFEDEWEKKKIRNVSSFLDSKRIPLSQSERKTKKGKYPYYGASGIIDYVEDYIFDGEYILLGEDGANILMRNSPLAFLASGKFWVNNHAHVIKANESNKFLAESLERIRYDKYNTGTAQPKLNAEVCKNIIIPIPTIQEQQKIATFLTAVDTKLQQLGQKKELLANYKKGVMQQLFSQQLRFKNDDSSDFPDWEEKKLGEIGNIVSGLTYSPKDIVDKKNGVLVLRSSNVKKGKLSFKDNVYVKVDRFNPVIKDDILICVRNGSKRLIGKNAIINTETQGVAFGAFMSIYRSEFNKYLFHYFSSYNYKKEVHKNLGATINSINGSDLKKFKVPFPSLKEQQKIANYLSAIDKKNTTIQTQIDKTQAFKKGLLQGMFV